MMENFLAIGVGIILLFIPDVVWGVLSSDQEPSTGQYTYFRIVGLFLIFTFTARFLIG